MALLPTNEMPRHTQNVCAAFKESKSHMEMSPSVAALLGSFGGIILTGIVTVATEWFRDKREDKKHRREIVIKTALENWKHTAEISASGRILPLSAYVLYMDGLCDVMEDKDMTREERRAKLAELSIRVEDVADQAKQIRPSKP